MQPLEPLIRHLGTRNPRDQEKKRKRKRTELTPTLIACTCIFFPAAGDPAFHVSSKHLQHAALSRRMAKPYDSASDAMMGAYVSQR